MGPFSSSQVRATGPRVSVVVPAFNPAEDILALSLRSIATQTWGDWECLVIDESTDAKRARACQDLCAQDPRFRYVRPDQRLGLAGSLNLGISLAKGELIARFDSDDMCMPQRLAEQVAFLDAHPDVGVVGSWMQIMDAQSQVTATRRYATEHGQIVRKFIYTNALAHPTVMLRKALVAGAEGAYRADFRYCEDLELWLRMLGRGVRFANMPEYLVTYRQDSTHRPLDNWKFNVRARWLHLSAPHRLLKLGAIGLLALWAYLPSPMREAFYKRTIFN